MKSKSHKGKRISSIMDGFAGAYEFHRFDGIKNEFAHLEYTGMRTDRQKMANDLKIVSSTFKKSIKESSNEYKS